MIQIEKNLYIGDMRDCIAYRRDNIAIVHACKTCHRRALGYNGCLSSSDSNYLSYEHGLNLYLNMVDMPNEFKPHFTNPIFESAMGFIAHNINTRPVLIHCDCGVSRSPSLGMVYLARHNIISSACLTDAMSDFIKLYPQYSPGIGIKLYMAHNWDYLMRIAA